MSGRCTFINMLMLFKAFSIFIDKKVGYTKICDKGIKPKDILRTRTKKDNKYFKKLKKIFLV